MRAGTLVEYTERQGDVPLPGIVLRVWEDGAIQLHVFHFEAATHIRSAHPSQVAVIIDPEKIEEILNDFGSLGFRIETLEEELESLRRELILIRKEHDPLKEAAKAQPVHSPLQAQPLQIDASLIDPMDDPLLPLNVTGTEDFKDEEQHSESEQAEPELQEVHVGSTRKKGRAAWPR